MAEALKIVDASDLDYALGAMQTTVEGDAETVMETILACHRRMLELAPRVLTHIAIDERKGATGRLEGKVRDVEEVLGKPLRRSGRSEAAKKQRGKSEATGKSLRIQ